MELGEQPLFNVWLFLQPFELARVRTANKSWHHSASTPVLWQRLAIRLWERWESRESAALLASDPYRAFVHRATVDKNVVKQMHMMCLFGFQDWGVQEACISKLVGLGPDAIEPLLRMENKCSFSGVTEGLSWKAEFADRISVTLDERALAHLGDGTGRNPKIEFSLKSANLQSCGDYQDASGIMHGFDGLKLETNIGRLVDSVR